MSAGEAVHPPRGAGAIRDWMVTARLSNLPTVWSNVFAGALLGGGAGLGTGLAAALFGGTLLYTGGMVLNDAADARIDRLRGVPRPVAAGRIGVAAAWLVAASMLLSGAALMMIADVRTWPLSTALFAAIVGYNLLNKRFGAAIVLMGLCRGLLIMVAAQAAGGNAFAAPVVALSAAVMLATVLITVVARDEHRTRPTPRARLGVLIGFIPAGLFAVSSAPSVHGLITALLWALASVMLGLRAAARLLRPPIAPRAAIMGWLAGLPLIDAVALALAESAMMWQLSSIPVVCALLTMAAHRRISGT